MQILHKFFLLCGIAFLICGTSLYAIYESDKATSDLNASIMNELSPAYTTVTQRVQNHISENSKTIDMIYGKK